MSEDDKPFVNAAASTVAWLAQVTRQSDGKLVLTGCSVDDAETVWQALGDQVDTPERMVRRLAAALRENGGEFDEPDLVLVADSAVIWEALSACNGDEEEDA